MSQMLHFAEYTLQEVALGVMATVYTLRILWLLRFKAGKERQGETGAAGTTPRKGILYSWGIIAMPWAMESSRKNLFMWTQFVVFHLAVVAAIGLSFIIPYGPSLLEIPGVVGTLQVLTGAACIIGVMRIIRRISSVYMRAISTPDDYFSVLLLTIWFGCATLAAPNSVAQGETVLLTFFFLTAFFLLYVPFSKISHYLYYPFTRYYFGKSMGYRGTYPLVHVAQPADRPSNEPAREKAPVSV